LHFFLKCSILSHSIILPLFLKIDIPKNGTKAGTL
jgi:hypothetical protein